MDPRLDGSGLHGLIRDPSGYRAGHTPTSRHLTSPEPFPAPIHNYCQYFRNLRVQCVSLRGMTAVVIMEPVIPATGRVAQICVDGS